MLSSLHFVCSVVYLKIVLFLYAHKINSSEIFLEFHLGAIGDRTVSQIDQPEVCSEF